MDKILLVNKDKGYTSRDVVNCLSQVFHTNKMGHFGTLDPLATGLLIIGIGKYTKVGNLFESDYKEYVAEALIGTSTDTYDVTGTITKKVDIKEIDKDVIINVLNKYRGLYLQEVPIYSAVKVNGKKLYEAINDSRISQIAWEKYGFRTGVTGGVYDVSKLQIGIPNNINSTVTSLKMDYYNKLIDYLKK